MERDKITNSTLIIPTNSEAKTIPKELTFIRKITTKSGEERQLNTNIKKISLFDKIQKKESSLQQPEIKITQQ